MKILVVEDEMSQLQFVLTVLKNNGFDVLGAESGSRGVDIARIEHPDLIITDIHMSDGGGFDLLSAIRSDASTATIPVILMTGLADRAGMRHGMELGADDYIPKPFTAEELVNAINSRLQKQQEVLRKANKKLDELRTSMSVTLPHELRTPLNGILGYADLLRKQAADLETAEVSKMAERIHKNAKRLQRLVENYLIYAQLELKQTELHKKEGEEMVTKDVEAKLDELARTKAKDFNRENDLDMKVEDVAVSFIPQYFNKVVEEVLDNAFKFSKGGTQVKVRGEVGDEGYLIKVQDSGRGMRADQIAEIGAFNQFDRKFFEQQGSGLGLTVARRLVQLHGGSLKIQSQVDVGTTVTVTLLQI